MPPEESTQLQSDLDVAICGPTHEDGWCKYCKAVQKLSTAVTEEREVCACLAESLIDLDENQDWQEGFNIACKILAHTIRARNRDVSVDKAVLSFKRLTRSIAAARTVKRLRQAAPSVMQIVVSL